MPITTDNPVVLLPVAEQTFDTWWVDRLGIDASRADTSTVVVEVHYRLCYLDGKGRPIFHPTEPIKRLILRDLFGFAAQDVNIATLINSVIDLLGELGKSQSVIS
jgi:hypothetical protein